MLAACDHGAAYARDRFAATVAAQFSSEGIHLEHSSAYHVWAIATIEKMLAHGYIDFGAVDILVAPKANALHFYYPDGTLTMIGDSGPEHVCSRRRYHPHLEYLCSGGAAGEAPTATTAFFPKSGYAFVRGGWDTRPLAAQPYFAMWAAFHSHVHKHADDLSLLWYERSRPILVDSGKYAYEGGKFRAYAVDARAHNVVEIDAWRGSRRAGDAYGSGLEVLREFAGGAWIRGSVHHREPDVRQTRLAVVRPGRDLLVVDRLTASEPHDYRQWFHLHESLTAVDLGGGRAAVRKGDAAIAAVRFYADADARRTSWCADAKRSPCRAGSAAPTCRSHPTSPWPTPSPRRTRCWRRRSLPRTRTPLRRSRAWMHDAWLPASAAATTALSSTSRR